MSLFAILQFAIAMFSIANSSKYITDTIVLFYNPNLQVHNCIKKAHIPALTQVCGLLF